MKLTEKLLRKWLIEFFSAEKSTFSKYYFYCRTFNKQKMRKITLLILCVLSCWCATGYAQISSVAIVGDAVGGWPNGGLGETDQHQMTSSDNVNWTYQDLVVSIGALKFRANNSWSDNWGANSGSASALSGIAAYNSSTNFTIAPGTYDVTFNSTTGAYTFVAEATGFANINMVGTALSGWEVNMPMFTTDGVHYWANGVDVLAGDMKFRQDSSWDNNWGGESFPSGTGISHGFDIHTLAGRYNITFNLQTLEYHFNYVVISIVGASSPAGWPTAGSEDTQLLSTEDGVNYTLTNIVLTAANGGDSGLKFRENHTWTVNWGSDEFPVGTATLGGNNIQPTAGTYSVSFNRVSGAFIFEEVLSTTDLSQNSVGIYPNPTSSVWNMNFGKLIRAEVKVSDLQGKTIYVSEINADTISVDASNWASGIYVVEIKAGNEILNRKLIKQ